MSFVISKKRPCLLNREALFPRPPRETTAENWIGTCGSPPSRGWPFFVQKQGTAMIHNITTLNKAADDQAPFHLVIRATGPIRAVVDQGWGFD